MGFEFWRKWLIGVSIYHVLFGLVLAFFSQSSLMDLLINQYYDPTFWPNGHIDAGAMRYKAWSSSVLGAVIASWGLLIAFIASVPFKRREKWAWISVASGLVLWFVVDTSCSIYFQIQINVVFNLSILLLFALPLLFTFRHFFGSASGEVELPSNDS